MKKIVLLLAGIAFLSTTSFAQDDKYTAAMTGKVMAADTTNKPEDLIALSASFERIAEAEKTKWLPYYYAALTQVNAAYMMNMQKPDAAKTDPIADKAEVLLSKAESLNKDNSEIYAVKKMIATLRYMVDPQNRYMKYKPAADEALQTAIKLNPENPRVYLLQAQDKYFTPEQYGGSKEEAKKLLEKAKVLFDNFKPASDISPNWGKDALEYFLSQYK